MTNRALFFSASDKFGQPVGEGLNVGTARSNGSGAARGRRLRRGSASTL
jgi:hypothetical protein